MLTTRIKEIKKFLDKDIRSIEMCTKEQKDYIEKYQFSIIKDIDNDYERIHWLVVIDGIINFEINNLCTSYINIKSIKDDVYNKEIKKAMEFCINDYIKELRNRKEEICKVINLIVPKEIKYRKFIKYHETK
ncbi:hypothetical protein KWV42_10385 [Clostridioides difficile]|uniref:hypothetical protein n=1 Tax=Clostridioides difficile TaxID=1496 RepID=UPI0010B50F3F|nr:hypothetical protein [Clostridioides difficile]MBY1883493.1 hypothetical protein [Clostridioides difficile]MBZ0781388.1 hypothetical protein [Clostridioides difficile]MBZ0855032.1 hypothetical protein [Clostridioides difficile]MCG7701618.1 hypothetical protein [Clostridioides difficile]